MTGKRNVIHIKWTSDEYDCDTCGPSYADGAIVTLDGEEILELTPAAYCYDGSHYERSEVFAELRQNLGYKLSEDYQ